MAREAQSPSSHPDSGILAETLGRLRRSKLCSCRLAVAEFSACAQLEEGDELEACLNRDSWRETAAIGDANLAECRAGDIIQLERKGFYRVDEAAGGGPDRPLVAFAIPDGRAAKAA